MKKIIAITIIFISILFFGVFASISLMDYQSPFQTFLSNSKFNINENQITNLKINKFPVPFVKIENIKLEEDIILHDIEIRFSLLSLIKFKPEIDSVKIARIRITKAMQNSGFIGQNDLISTIIKNLGVKIDLKIDDLIIYDVDNNPILVLKNFDLFKTDISNSKFTGSFGDNGKISGVYSKQDKGKGNFQLTLSKPYYKFTINGDLDQAKLVSGKGECEVHDVAGLVSDGFPDIRAMFNNIASKDNIKINFEVISNDDYMQFKNIAIVGTSIDGKGVLTISKLADKQTELSLNFSQINLDSMFDVNAEDDKAGAQTQHNSKKMNFGNNMLAINIAVDSLTFGEVAYDEIKFSSALKEGNFSIHDFSGHSNQGEFKVIGEITQNSFRSIFDGKIYFKHKDINKVFKGLGYSKVAVDKVTPLIFSTNIKATLIDWYMQNVSIVTDNANIRGDIAFKFIGSTPRVNMILSISSIDLNKQEYPIISPLLSFVTDLTQGMKDKDYFNKFIPIRTLGYIGNFDITFNDLFFDKLSLGKVNLLMNLSPGKAVINNLYVNNGKDYLATSIDLIASGLKPTLNIVINDGTLHLDFLSPRTMLAFRNTILNQFDVDKILLKLDCKLSKLFQKDIEIDNLQFSLVNDGTLFKISDIEAKIFGGNLKGSGSILLDPYTLNFVYALNSIDLNSISTNLPTWMYSTPGVGSINGMFTTNGDSIEKLLYNLYAKSSVIAKDIKINNFSIDHLIGIVSSEDYNTQNLESDIKTALLTGENTIQSLNSDVEISNGVLLFKNMNIKTKYASASVSATINIYDFGINLSSMFSFYAYEKGSKRSYQGYNPVKMGLKVTGTVFSPQKVADSNELSQFLQSKRSAPKGGISR